jgi:hypothetical protein
MALRDYSSASIWLGRALTGQIARRVYVSIILLMLFTTTVVRVYSYVLTHKSEQVVSGLSKLHIDVTTEEEVLQKIPYLTRDEWFSHVEPNAEVGNIDKGVGQWYSVTFSNEPSYMSFEKFALRFSNVEVTKEGHPRSWIFTAADLLGFRYIYFGASVMLLNGRVSSIRYGVSNEMVFPRQIGEIFSVTSVHARWAPYRSGFEVPSIDDENFLFDVAGSDRSVRVIFTPEASPASMSRVFQVNLSCFWGLFACRHVRQIAPLLWQDGNEIFAATLARLNSNEPCPDRILAGRAKYLPDTDISLLESTGFSAKSIGEGVYRTNGFVTHYKLIEVLQGRWSNSRESFWIGATIPYPGDYYRKLPNKGLQWVNAGERVLAFSNLTFDSCQIVSATASAISAVRNAIPAPRRQEDELVRGGLQ